MLPSTRWCARSWIVHKFSTPPGFKKAGERERADAHRPVDDTGARLDVLHVATETITLTRTFGMVPASRGDIVAPALLDRVVVAANAFVKAGASLDPALLEGTTLVAVKRFYAAAREVLWLDPVRSVISNFEITVTIHYTVLFYIDKVGHGMDDIVV